MIVCTQLGSFYTQQKYFNSLFLIHNFFGVIRVPLPGVYLLLALISVNLVCGGLIRIRKNKYTPGIIIAHVGMLVMIAGGFVTYHFSERGNMTLYEKESSDEFISYYDLVIEIGQAKAENKLLIIPQEHFIDLCRLLGQPTPAEADPEGTWYTFEKGATKQSGGEGWADLTVMSSECNCSRTMLDRSRDHQYDVEYSGEEQ